MGCGCGCRRRSCPAPEMHAGGLYRLPTWWRTESAPDRLSAGDDQKPGCSLKDFRGVYAPGEEDQRKGEVLGRATAWPAAISGQTRANRKLAIKNSGETKAILWRRPEDWILRHPDHASLDSNLIPKGLSIPAEEPFNRINRLRIGSPPWTRFELSWPEKRVSQAESASHFFQGDIVTWFRTGPI